MIEEVKLPEISENVESGVVIAALVKVGDFVDKEQPLVELETEKASGKVVEMSVSEEDDVKVGQVIAKIDTDAQASGQEEEETVEAQPTPVVEEKAAVPEVVEQPEVRHETQPQEEKPAPAKAVSAAPAVRQLARELGIDIALVSGSGQGGRISAEDVRDHADSVKAASKWAGVGGASIPLPDFAKWGQVERQAMTVTRRKIAETLSYAWANVPHVTQHDQANITALEQFRAEYAERVGQAGGKLTVTSILVKVVASALKTFPKFNSSVDTEANEIIFKKYYHISVAVDTDRGLLVPTIRDADKKSILQLSVELKDIAERARNNKLTPDEMTGGNFTISNLGGIGGTAFSPIIYWPQVAILGVSRTRRQGEYVDGEIRPQLILPLSLSYDHRIIDGTDAVRFLRWIVEALEKPFLIALDE
ncbi:MAG: 2-oxo acid dehydrogenase subunit E2 [Planctomycetota bacterium]|jgi:pyruvate dehydrogenase E2 component (dihydrolipoamide acetyltransferase)